MIDIVLSWLGTGLLVGSVLARCARLIREHQACGIRAVAFGLYSIAEIHENEPLLAALSAALCAWDAHDWWRGGGGDGTRRRLRSLRRRFTAVRRTAPAPT